MGQYLREPSLWLVACAILITTLLACAAVPADSPTRTSPGTTTPSPSLAASAHSSPLATASPRSPAEEAAETARDEQYLTQLRAQIKGHGKDPAETVFKDIQILKGRPAGAVLSIMDVAYNKSLGVHCSYCHDPKDWAADAKNEKAIARQMSGMLHDINEKYLKSIVGLKSEKPVVNCTTCHRGQERPALDLPESTPATHR
jgi:Photosynthetic reaction centre cytochrome C subunit